MPTTSQASSCKAGDDESRPLAVAMPDRAVRLALEILYRAAAYAKDADSDRWQFAVECEHLRASEISPSTLRWMIHKGFVLLGEEITTLRDNERRFRKRSAPLIRDSSCFVLTEQGLAFAVQMMAQAVASVPLAPTVGDPTPYSHPNWDPLLRELWVGAELVKRYSVPAPNQERILSAFMEEKWPTRIDDPLPPVDGMEPKRRLQAAIMCLNRNQRVRVLRFRGNGKGDGIRWEFNSQLEIA